MLKNLFIGSVFWLLYHISPAQTGIQRTEKFPVTEPILLLLGDSTSLPAEGSISGYHSDGGIHYQGTIRKFKLHGSWQRWYINNNILEEGRLIKGIPEGEWKVWYSDGNLRYIRTYSYKKNEIIRQEWRRPNPRMNLYPITLEYLKDKIRVNSELQSVANFELDGDAAEFPALFNECLPHGLYMNFREDGTVSDSGYYKNGLKDGVWIEDTDTNKFWKGYYHNGNKDGEWKLYSEDKILEEMMIYKNGKVMWRKKMSREGL